MALITDLLRTCGFIVFLVFHIQYTHGIVSEPWIISVEVTEKTCVANKCKYLLNVNGGEFLGHYSWRFTLVEGTRGGACGQTIPDYELQELETSQWKTKIQLEVPEENGRIYFCLQQWAVKSSSMDKQWVHQGTDLFLDPRNDTVTQKITAKDQTQEPSASTVNGGKNRDNWADLSHDTDVNHLTTVKLTRDEEKEIELSIRNKYVPLNQIRNEKNSINHVKGGTKEVGDQKDLNSNFYVRNKRDSTVTNVENKSTHEIETSSSKIIEGTTTENVVTHANKLETNDDLISTKDIIEAKKNPENSVKLKPKKELSEDSLIKIRKLRQTNKQTEATITAEPITVKIEGLRVEDSDKEPKIIDESVPSVLADTKVTLRLFGDGLTRRTIIAFTYDPQQYGMPCKFLVKGEYLVKKESLTARTATFDVIAPPPLASSKLYICAKNLHPNITDPNQDLDKYIHQGVEPYKILATHTKLLPLWVTLILVLVCLMFSALFSGLNLGLMSLDRTELKIISNTGTEKEKKYARAIMPVRDHGNYLLCSILLGNVAVNSTFTILLDDLTSGLFAVIFSTLAIVLLGEITPQAICSRHGLMVGAKSIMITKSVMAVTAPLAYPVSKLLDYFLGEEIGSVYNRERLKELVKVMYDQVTTDVNDLDKDEVNIISGALELRKKTVASVMTKLEDVFMLPITSVLDFETMSEIVKSGFSRIPVYEGHRGNIVTVLFIKDLAFVDPDDNTPLRTLCQYYQNPCNFVFEDVTLDVMFKQFKDGHKGHMAFVRRINNEGEGDPFYETTGLITLEDVIEEMIQAEIVDETDVFMDNRTKRKRNRPINKLQDFLAFAERHDNQRVHISPQLTLATFQFLSTSVDAFRPELVSETVLRRLLRQDVIHYIKIKGKDKKDPSTYVFFQGKPVDYFILILEGRVEVTVGRENLVFEAGPFTYFGVQALTQNAVAESPTVSANGSVQNLNIDSMLKYTFVPDYSVRAITDTYYLTVKRSLYLAAKRATLMEKGALSKGNQEQFDNEVDKNACTSTEIPTPLITQKLLTLSTNPSSTPKPCRSNAIELNHEFVLQRASTSEPQEYLISEPPRYSLREIEPQNDANSNKMTKTACDSDLNAYKSDLKTPRMYNYQEVSGSCEDKSVPMSNLSDGVTGGSVVDLMNDRNVSRPFDDFEQRLLESVDDVSSSGDHKTPSRQLSPYPPVSASLHTRSSFVSRSSQERPETYRQTDTAATAEEQEKLIAAS